MLNKLLFLLLYIRIHGLFFIKYPKYIIGMVKCVVNNVGVNKPIFKS